MRVGCFRHIYSAQTRSGLISDAFAAAQIDRLDYETVFQLLEYLPKEKSDLVWHMVKNGLASIVDFYGNEPDGEWAMRYARKLMEVRKEDVLKNVDSKKRKATMRRNHTAKETLDKNEKLFVTTANLSGKEQRGRRESLEQSEEYTSSEPSMNDFLKRSFIESYCNLGSQNCSSTFRSIFEREVYRGCGHGQKASQCVRVRRHFRGCTYCYGVKELGATALEKVKNLYNIEDVEEEKENLRQGMSCTQDVHELKQQLMSAMDGSADIRLQDIASTFTKVSRNPVAQELMLNFLIDNWEMIYARMGSFKQVEKILKSCLGKIRSDAQIALALSAMLPQLHERAMVIRSDISGMAAI
ncbi:hypothetical protein Y032_0021g381 [Ancylostoma ceylanicum]|uniref:ERAP1-like C-terminal domain-containing protein n=1 Tax=Ancylostoma ceylanicum TaxID=53326 RepID=A0A016V121_9BILA|nr:hypothetical protein Y032_0021g381 [Ancylostoma ceylanicum]